MGDIATTERDGVVLWRLDYPPVNAISFEMLERLEELLTAAQQNQAVRAVVVIGNGPTFAAGADIQGFLKLGGSLLDFMKKGSDLFSRVEQSRLPFVAAVNGAAYGGGNELAMVCDIRLASPQARFGQPEVNLGIIPGWGGTVRLPRLVGMARARRILLTGDAVTAEEAQEIGLVDRVVDSRLLVDAALNMGDRLASLAPQALAAIKKLLADPNATTPSAEMAAMKELMAGQDVMEGIRAFLAHRRPHFVGQ